MTKPTGSLATLLVCAVTACAPSAPPPAPPPGQDLSYTPRFTPGVPILSQVKPDEQVVEVLVDRRPDLAMEPDAEKEVDGLTGMAAAVAVVRVVDKRSAFTGRGDWITSSVTVQVQTLLKDPDRKLAEGGTLSFFENSGELVVDGRRVIARSTYEVPMRVGETYLVFFWLSEGKLQNIGPTWTFRVDGQTLQRLRTDIDPRLQLDHQTLEWAQARIRARAGLPKANGAR